MMLSVRNNVENDRLDINSQMEKIYGFKQEKHTLVIENLVASIREIYWVKDNVSSIISNNVWYTRKEYWVERKNDEKEKILDMEYFRWLIWNIEKHSKQEDSNSGKWGFTRVDYVCFSENCRNAFEKISCEPKMLLEIKKEALEKYLSLALPKFIDSLLEFDKMFSILDRIKDSEDFIESIKQKNYNEFLTIIRWLEPFINIEQEWLDDLMDEESKCLSSTEYNFPMIWFDIIKFQGDQVLNFCDKVYDLIERLDLNYKNVFLEKWTLTWWWPVEFFKTVKQGGYIRWVEPKTSAYYDEVIKFMTRFIPDFTDIIDVDNYYRYIILPTMAKSRYKERTWKELLDVKFTFMDRI